MAPVWSIYMHISNVDGCVDFRVLCQAQITLSSELSPTKTERAVSFTLSMLIEVCTASTGVDEV